MSKKLNRFLALESAEVIEQRLEGSEEPVVPVETAEQELGEVEEALDESLDVHDELSALANQVQTDSENGKLSAEALGYANALAKVHLSRVGLGALATGMESTYSPESIGKRVKEVWEMVKKFIKMMYDKLVAFFKSIFSKFGKTKEELKQKEEELKTELKTSNRELPNKETKDEPKSTNDGSVRVTQAMRRLFWKHDTKEEMLSRLKLETASLGVFLTKLCPNALNYIQDRLSFLLEQAKKAGSEGSSYVFPEPGDEWLPDTSGLTGDGRKMDLDTYNLTLPLGYIFQVALSDVSPEHSIVRVRDVFNEAEDSYDKETVEAVTLEESIDLVSECGTILNDVEKLKPTFEKVVGLLKQISELNLKLGTSDGVDKLVSVIKRQVKHTSNFEGSVLSCVKRYVDTVSDYALAKS
jgi:hypothetical protein